MVLILREEPTSGRFAMRDEREDIRRPQGELSDPQGMSHRASAFAGVGPCAPCADASLEAKSRYPESDV